MYGRVWREEWKERNVVLILSKIKLKRKKKVTKISLKLDQRKQVKVDITRFHHRRQSSSSH